MGAAGGAVRVTVCVAFLLLSISSLRTVTAITFSVQNRAPTTPGGRRFDRVMGEAWTIKMLDGVSKYIVKALSLSYRLVDHVTFIVEGENISVYSSNDVIHVGANFIDGIAPEKLQFVITGLMFRLVCYSFQNNRGDYSGDLHFRGVIQGIATYMAYNAGYTEGKNKKGGKWYDGHHTTAHFFAWIVETESRHFVNLLNERMGEHDYNDDFFIHLTGKNVDALWALYRQSFGKTTKQ